jgi:hypothetical protein
MIQTNISTEFHVLFTVRCHFEPFFLNPGWEPGKVSHWVSFTFYWIKKQISTQLGSTLVVWNHLTAIVILGLV